MCDNKVQQFYEKNYYDDEHHAQMNSQLAVKKLIHIFEKLCDDVKIC